MPMHQCNRCHQYTIPEASIAVICCECKEKEEQADKEWMRKKQKEKMDKEVRDIF
jgi:hypothetical protein